MRVEGMAIETRDTMSVEDLFNREKVFRNIYCTHILHVTSNRRACVLKWDYYYKLVSLIRSKQQVGCENRLKRVFEKFSIVRGVLSIPYVWKCGLVVPSEDVSQWVLAVDGKRVSHFAFDISFREVLRVFYREGLEEEAVLDNPVDVLLKKG